METNDESRNTRKVVCFLFSFEVLNPSSPYVCVIGDIRMDVQTISVVIAAVSVVIGVINSILSSRRAEKNDEQMLETRQAQLYMQLYNRWNSLDFAKAYTQVRYVY